MKMTNQFNPILTESAFEFLYAMNYRIILTDADGEPLNVDYWTIRNYELSFNEYASTLKFQIFGLTKPLDIDMMRRVKIVKLIFMNLAEHMVAVSTYEVTQFKGSLFGDYNSDSLLTYNIEMAVK